MVFSCFMEIAHAGDQIRVISQPANSIAYSASSGLVYAAVPSSAAANANTLLPINPYTGSAGSTISIGTNPTTVVASSDGTNLYAVVNNTTGVQRYNVPTQTADQSFSVGGGSHIGQVGRYPALRTTSWSTLIFLRTVRRRYLPGSGATRRGSLIRLNNRLGSAEPGFLRNGNQPSAPKATAFRPRFRATPIGG